MASRIPDDQAQRVCTPPREPTGMGVLVEIKLSNDLEDSLSGFGSNVTRVIDHMRNCGDGDSHPFGYLFHALRHLCGSPSRARA